MLLNPNYDDYLMPRLLHRVHRPFINGTTTALFCMCVSVCDVPVDKFAVCVWLLSACGSMCVWDRGVLNGGRVRRRNFYYEKCKWR